MVVMSENLAEEKVWLNKFKYSEAERKYYEKIYSESSKNDKGATNEKQDNSSGRKRVPSKSNDAEVEVPIEAPRTPQNNKAPATSVPTTTPQTNEPAAPRSNKSNKNKNKKAHSEVPQMDDIANMTSGSPSVDQANRIAQLEKNNSQLKNQVQDLVSVIAKLEARIAALELGKCAPAKSATPAKSPAPAKASAPPADDDDVDLFGSESEEEDDAAKKVKEQRLAEYNARKSKKPVLIAKSNIILDVKPWDDETDMKAMEKSVRDINMDGLIWGASKLVPLAYGIHKLQISCVVEDEKVSVDLLTETIEGIEDYVQSVDIAAFNKV